MRLVYTSRETHNILDIVYHEYRVKSPVALIDEIYRRSTETRHNAVYEPLRSFCPILTSGSRMRFKQYYYCVENNPRFYCRIMARPLSPASRHFYVIERY